MDAGEIHLTVDPRRIIHLKGFPYSVIYRVTEKQIRILVIRHDARREEFGLERK